MNDEYGKPMHSEKYPEMTFTSGKVVRTVSQFGGGRLDAVQAGLGHRPTASEAR